MFGEKDIKCPKFAGRNSHSTESSDSGIESPTPETSPDFKQNSQQCTETYTCMKNMARESCTVSMVSRENSSYTCTCTIEKQSAFENGLESDISVISCTCTVSIIPNPSSVATPYEIPAPDTIVAMDCEFVGVQPKNTSALGK